MICNVCGKDLKHVAHGLCQKCYGAKYYAEHKDEILQVNAKYCAKHKDKIQQSNKEYRMANQDRCSELNRKYRRAHGGKAASENKQCSVFLGVHVAERVLSKVFKDVKQMPYGQKGYDFVCIKDKKIDVKCSCTYTNHRCMDSWAFQIKKNTIADYFLCLAFDNREDLNPLHVWLIPGNLINHLKNASISESTLSKWDAHKLDIRKTVTCCDSMKHSNHRYGRL